MSSKSWSRMTRETWTAPRKSSVRAELGTNWRAIVRDYRNYRAEYAHALNERQGEAHHTPWHAQQTAVAAAGTDDTAAKSAMTVGAKALAK